MSKFYITTPIYYLNAEPHIGHALTTVAADVLARQRRMVGEDVWFLTGTDEHGQKIERAAKETGIHPQSYVDQMAAKFSFAWDRLESSHNDFIRTTDERHKKAVNKFLGAMLDSGKIYKGQYEGLYCVGHEAFLKDSELVEGLCPDHKTKPEHVIEENWFFKLSDFSEILRDKIEKGEMIIAPPERKNEVLGFLKLGLEDFTISRPNVKWGIPLPFDASQTTYVWVDALINYISAIGYENDPAKFEKYWPADLHLVGKDILRFHAVYWPAMLIAAGLPMPGKIFAHGYFTVDGQKMSKTIGNVIDPNEWADKYGADTVRYFLLREIPFGADGDVSEEKLQARYRADLANTLGNLFSRLTNMIEKYTDGQVPDITESTQIATLDEVDELTAQLKFSQALEKIWTVLDWANQKIDKEKPWQLAKAGDEARLRELLNNLIATLYKASEKLAPYMPETAEKMRAVLSAEKIVKAEPLFPLEKRQIHTN